MVTLRNVAMGISPDPKGGILHPGTAGDTTDVHTSKFRIADSFVYPATLKPWKLLAGGVGPALQIKGGDPDPGDGTAGGDLTGSGGTGDGAGAGGKFIITGGPGGASSTLGGDVTVTSGGAAAGGTSGTVAISTGGGTAGSGDVSVYSGPAITTSGNASHYTGPAITTGNVSIYTGTAITTSGGVSLSSGTGPTSGPVSIYVGNAITVAGALTMTGAQTTGAVAGGVARMVGGLTTAGVAAGGLAEVKGGVSFGGVGGAAGVTGGVGATTGGAASVKGGNGTTTGGGASLQAGLGATNGDVDIATQPVNLVTVGNLGVTGPAGIGVLVRPTGSITITAGSGGIDISTGATAGAATFYTNTGDNNWGSTAGNSIIKSGASSTITLKVGTTVHLSVTPTAGGNVLLGTGSTFDASAGVMNLPAGADTEIAGTPLNANFTAANVNRLIDGSEITTAEASTVAHSHVGQDALVVTVTGAILGNLLYMTGAGTVGNATNAGTMAQANIVGVGISTTEIACSGYLTVNVTGTAPTVGQRLWLSGTPGYATVDPPPDTGVIVVSIGVANEIVSPTVVIVEYAVSAPVDMR